MSAALLETKGLRKSYPRGKGSFFAVNDVTLSIETGAYISIAGRSGGGKSTLLRLITGLARPDGGTVVFEDLDITSLPDEDVSIVRGTRMGYIPQGQSVLFSLSVLDNVTLPLSLLGRKAPDIENAETLLDRVGIAHLAQESPRHLSGGELRRVAIARSLVWEPALLIADEPTADLDPETTGQILDLFDEINAAGTAIILVTHEADAAVRASVHYHLEGGILS